MDLPIVVGRLPDRVVERDSLGEDGHSLVHLRFVPQVFVVVRGQTHALGGWQLEHPSLLDRQTLPALGGRER